MSKNKFLIMLVSLVIVSILIICGYASFGAIPSDTFVEDVDIGGLTVMQAENKIKESLSHINFKYSSYNFSFTPEEIGINIDYKNSFKSFRGTQVWEKVLLNFQEKRFYLVKNYDDKKMEEAFKTINKIVSTSPRDAFLIMKNGELITKQERWGTEVDIALLKTQIINKPLKSQYYIPVKTVRPERRMFEMEALKPDILLARYTTEFVKNFNRTANIKIASEAINNTLLAPGETFSFNEIVGPREVENGYLSAMVISGGQFIPGLGGGICQVSSTLYNTALLAGLEIVERYPHSLRINYVPLGRDATVNYGFKDFKFKNNTKGYLLINYKIEGQNLTFSIYGNKQWADTVKVIDIPHHVLKIIEPPEKIIIDEQLQTGENKVESEGSAGYIVNTFRIIEINGQEQKEFLAKDYYSPLTKIIKKIPN